MNHILDSFIIPSPTGVTTNLGAINILGNRLLTRIPEHFKIFDQTLEQNVHSKLNALLTFL